MTTSVGPRSRLLLSSTAALVLGVAGIAALVVALAGPIAGLVIVAGLLAVAALVYAPGVLFALYLLIPFYKGALDPYSPVDITVVLAILNVLQLLPVVLGRRRLAVSRAGLGLWVVLACLILGGVLYAPDQSLALDHAITWWILVFLPLLAAFRVGSDPRYVRQFLWTIFGMASLVVVLGMSQLSRSERLEVLGANTIAVGRAAVLVPLIGVVFVLQQPYRLLWLVALGLTPPAVMVALASGSRGPLVVLGILALIGAARYLSRPRSVNWRLTGAIAGLGVVSLFVVSYAISSLPGLSLQRYTLFGDFVQSALAGDINGPVGDTSSATRVALFKVATALFQDHPILGVGTAGFETSSPRYLGPTEVQAYPHNAILQFAAEYGLVGVSLFGAFVVLAYVRRLPRGSPGNAVRVVLLFFLLNAMLSGDIFSDRETWSLLMLVLLIDAPRVIGAVAGRLALPGPETQPAAGFASSETS